MNYYYEHYDNDNYELKQYLYSINRDYEWFYKNIFDVNIPIKIPGHIINQLDEYVDYVLYRFKYDHDNDQRNNKLNISKYCVTLYIQMMYMKRKNDEFKYIKGIVDWISKSLKLDDIIRYNILPDFIIEVYYKLYKDIRNYDRKSVELYMDLVSVSQKKDESSSRDHQNKSIKNNV
jgi:hypothetical protein